MARRFQMVRVEVGQHVSRCSSEYVLLLLPDRPWAQVEEVNCRRDTILVLRYDFAGAVPSEAPAMGGFDLGRQLGIDRTGASGDMVSVYGKGLWDGKVATYIVRIG